MKFSLLYQIEYTKLRYLRNKLIPEKKVTQFVVLSRFWLVPPASEEHRHHARSGRCPQPLNLAITWEYFWKLLKNLPPYPLQKVRNKKMPQLRQEVMRTMTRISDVEVQNPPERGLDWIGDSLFFITSTCWRTASSYLALFSLTFVSGSDSGLVSDSFCILLSSSGAFKHMI